MPLLLVLVSYGTFGFSYEPLELAVVSTALVLYAGLISLLFNSMTLVFFLVSVVLTLVTNDLGLGALRVLVLNELDSFVLASLSTQSILIALAYFTTTTGASTFSESSGESASLPKSSL